MKKFLKKKNILGKIIIPIIFLVIFIIPVVAFAQASTNTAGTQAGSGREIGINDAVKNSTNIAYLIGSFVGWFLSFTIDLVNFAINLGNNVLKIDAVTTGWGIVLQIANLGFVLAIIVMAFATIFQQQSYAMKNTLWKLIVAALLINFSLVIAGGFISISTFVNNVFLKAIGNDLGSALGNAMSPQIFFKVNGLSVTSIFGGLLSGLLKFFISLIFIIIFTILMVFAMLTLFVMFLYRVIALIFLLILAPLAWLAWIFPLTSKYWSKWWSEFLRWNFFAPVVMFFIYLAITIAADINKLQLYNDISDPAKAAEAGVILDPLALKHAANLLVILGMLYSGIYIANKLGIEGGELGVKWAKNTGSKAKDFAGRKFKQYGSAPFRAKRWGPKDEKGNRKSVSEYLTGKAQGMGWVGRNTIGRLAREAARLEKTGGKGILEHYEKKAGEMSVAELKAVSSTATGPYQMAILKELQKKKSLGDINALKFINKDTQALFNRYGEGSAWSDIEKGAKMNVNMADILKISFQKGLTSEEIEKLQSETNNFVKSFKGADIEKSVLKDLYGGGAKLGLDKDTANVMGGMFANAFATNNYQQAPKIMPTMNAKERDNFIGKYGAALQGNAVDQKAKDAWGKILNNFASTGGAGGVGDTG